LCRLHKLLYTLQTFLNCTWGESKGGGVSLEKILRYFDMSGKRHFLTFNVCKFEKDK
jgi:hypothetical protein